MPQSRQLNFFLSPSDQKFVEEAISSCGPFAIFDSRSSSSHPQKRADMRVAEFGKEPLRILISQSMYESEIMLTRIRGSNEYSASVLKMPIIEFDRCFLGDKFIRRGRVYAVMEYYDENGDLVKKPKAFAHWIKCVFGEIKDSLTQTADGKYVGEEALSLNADGWSLKSL